MVTKIKPRRMNTSSSGSLGKDLAYQTESVFDRGVGGGDMKYADFDFQDLTGSTVTLGLSTEVTPTGNFVVVAPSDIKDGQQYILRVNNGATTYTMGLAGNTSNPYNIPLSLTPNATDQFIFLAVGGVLELQKNIDRVASIWGGIIGTLSDQTDLQNALDDKQDELTPSTGINIDSSNNISNTLPGPRISSTAPSNPTEGMEWYDTTNDVLKVYDGSNWKIIGDSEANTKTFYLSSASDLTTAQDALDWYLAGKNPIVVYNSRANLIYDYSSTELKFIDGVTKFHPQAVGASSSSFIEEGISFTISSNTVTAINPTNFNINSGDVLRTDLDYGIPYTPTYDGSPTTKKYVDNNDTYIGSSAPSNPVEGRLWYDTTNDVLKVYDGANRNNVNTQVTVEDNLTSTSTTNALSANQGRILNGKISDLMALGKFLSLWNATTGQPISFPYNTPYAYSTGDYFLVETVDATTNYRPNGSSYTGTASSTVETDEIEQGDVYIYDGSVWLLQSNHGKTVTFANIAGQPTDNTNLATALAAKQDTLIAGSNISIASDGKTISADVITKIFTLSSTSDITHAQEAIDRVVAGKNAIVKLGEESYVYANKVTYESGGVTTGYGHYFTRGNYLAAIPSTYETIRLGELEIETDASNDVTTISTKKEIYHFLDTDVDYTTPYIPLYDGSPATKKYVDDHAVPAVGTNGQVLTVVNGAAAWANGGGGGGGIQNDTTGTTTTVTAIWAGTEAEYNALQSHSSSVIYHIY